MTDWCDVVEKIVDIYTGHKTWPDVPPVDEDDWDELDNEPLDTENFEFISFDPAIGITVDCGGDWQYPHRLILKVDGSVQDLGKADYGEDQDDIDLDSVMQWLTKLTCPCCGKVRAGGEFG